MRILKDSQKSTELDEQDLETIQAVYMLTQAMAEESPDLPPVITFRGPETAEIFAKMGCDTDEWAEGFPSLGQWAEIYGASYPSNPGKKVFRHVERWFVGSPVFPRGIPVGTYDNHAMSKFAGSEYKLSNTSYDVQPTERELIHALAFGKVYNTQSQIKAIRERRNALKRQSQEPGNEAAMQMFAQIMQAVTEKSMEAQAAKRVETNTAVAVKTKGK